MNIASASSGQCQIYRKAEIVVGVWPNRDLMYIYIYITCMHVQYCTTSVCTCVHPLHIFLCKYTKHFVCPCRCMHHPYDMLDRPH